jgi:hypothetical protein
MPDAISAVSSANSAAPISAWQESSDSARPAVAKELASPDSAALQDELASDELMNELSVQVALTTFVIARDEIRRQGEQITARMKEAQEESE